MDSGPICIEVPEVSQTNEISIQADSSYFLNYIKEVRVQRSFEVKNNEKTRMASQSFSSILNPVPNSIHLSCHLKKKDCISNRRYVYVEKRTEIKIPFLVQKRSKSDEFCKGKRIKSSRIRVFEKNRDKKSEGVLKVPTLGIPISDLSVKLLPKDPMITFRKAKEYKKYVHFPFAKQKAYEKIQVMQKFLDLTVLNAKNSIPQHRKFMKSRNELN